MEYKFGIKSSSSDEIYTVTFKFDKLITINCNCQAGLVKLLCKHRLNLMDGDITSLANPSDSSILPEVLNKIDKNKVSNLYNDLNAIETEIKTLEATRKKLRKEIGFKFSNGF
jgi:hypothetical protein